MAEICDWIDAQGGPELDIAEVFVIIDSYLYNTPPTGYTFIPTLQNVFGVIDYYLGFDGDALTGCAFFREDFLTYTLVDDGFLTTTSNRATCTDILRNSNCYLFKDFGTDAIKDFDISFAFSIVGGEIIDEIPTVMDLFAVSDEPHYTYEDRYWMEEGLGSLGIAITAIRTATWTEFHLRDWNVEPTVINDVKFLASPNSQIEGIVFYINVVRVGMDVTVSLYDNQQMTNLIATGTITLINAKDYSILVPISSRDDAGTQQSTMSGWVENYLINQLY